MGRPRTITEHDLFDRLTGVFRASGYDGASLTRLSTASGLRSASLYHRFPGGKPGMAVAVLDEVERRFGEVLEPLTSVGDPADGVREMAHRLATFYDDGHLACVLDTMTLDGAPDDVRQRASGLARAWIAAMTEVAARSGADAAESARRGREAFVKLEGSLVLARVLDDPSEFVGTLDDLPRTLTGPEDA